MTPQPSAELPARRVVLLGASNLRRGISTVVETSCAVWGRPLDILATPGHGRSYGLRQSYVLARGLPGILHCRLWRDWDDRPPAPTAALLTDVGNDILFGVDVDRIEAWVTECLERLTPRVERIVMTELPLTNLLRMGPQTFLILRRILFPSSRLRYEEAMRQASELNERVKQLAERFAARLIAPQPSWYGVDPIHIRRRYMADAWRAILSPWRDETAPTITHDSLARWIYLRRLRPQRRTLFGFEQRRPQPAGRLRDGTRLSFY